ncbi:MAG: hypothetical protein QGG48_12355, partial [Desulfatiglandales bacterium]|nr:hypothetical protein [Desulfatiglandales bacterium]
MGKSMAPLLDVILIVMTVFMVTAAVAIERMGERERLGPPIHLPKTLKSLEKKIGLSQRKPITLSLKEEKKGGASFYLGNRLIPSEKIESELHKINPSEVILRVGRGVTHRHTAIILQFAEKMKFAV